jgi:rhamnosyltransferase
MAVCAIVVTYHPDRELPARMHRILRQIGSLIVVDNGSSDEETRMLRMMAANPRIDLVLNADNLGVASALNIGIARAAARGFEWVLLLDQDSVPRDDMVQQLETVRAAYPSPSQLAVIGSNFTDVNKESPEARAAVGAHAAGTPEAGADAVGAHAAGAPEAGADAVGAHAAGVPEGGADAADALWEELDYVITSGSLISLAAYTAIGPFREELFIDYVDMDYCLRARARGFRVIKTRTPLMTHAIGAYTQHRWLGKTKWTTNHSPDRRYYIARNDTVMLREYGNYPAGLWRWKSFVRSFRLCKRIALYERMKLPKIMAVGQGWWHGVRGRLGPRPR